MVRWNDLDYSIEKTRDWQLFLCTNNHLMNQNAFPASWASKSESLKEIDRNGNSNEDPTNTI